MKDLKDKNHLPHLPGISLSSAILGIPGFGGEFYLYVLFALCITRITLPRPPLTCNKIPDWPNPKVCPNLICIRLTLWSMCLGCQSCHQSPALYFVSISFPLSRWHPIPVISTSPIEFHGNLHMPHASVCSTTQ